MFGWDHETEVLGGAHDTGEVKCLLAHLLIETVYLLSGGLQGGF